MGISDTEIYKALFGLSQVLAGHTDLEPLCNSLAESLNTVVSFDFLALVLHDRVRGQLRLRALSGKKGTARPDISVSVTDGYAASVWRDQQSLTLSPLENSPGLSEPIRAELSNAGVRALTLVPLSNGNHRLGILGFGFDRPVSPGEREMALLQRVASEMAVSVEGCLTRQALRHERDRMKALFDVTTALVTKLPLDELFAAISEEISRVVQHDFAIVALLDPNTHELRLSALHSRDGLKFEPEESSASPVGLPVGEALATGQPVVTTGLDFERFPSPLYRKYSTLGYLAGCSIPLIGRNGPLGALDLARRRPEAFTSDEVDLLVQVARQIAIATENALAFHELEQMRDKLATEKLYLEDEIRTDQNVGNMIGESPAFQAVWSGIKVVAPTTATVLIEGETGTGKELVARALHDLSGRSNRSFIKVNCAAIPATLLESELFGHEKGSFTGAFAQKIGRFELAHQGTLFLDEIGEIPLELQSKLLRAIQEQEFERVGGNRTIRVDVRIVAATNRGLKQMVDEGKFRGDLFYRLHVFPLSVPPLRERKDDIPLLVRYFTQKYAKRMNRHIEAIPSGVFDLLTHYHWPGNIRELQNVIERSVILSPGRVLRVAMPEISNSPPALAPRSTGYNAAAERQRILNALNESHGKVAGPHGAAARLGLRRTTLQSRMKKLGIERQYS